MTRRPILAVTYIVGYVALDWASYVYPYGAFGITPWNPPAGLSFALVLVLGRGFIPFLLAAPLLADYLVRGWPLDTRLDLAASGGAAIVYAATLYWLTASWVRFDASLGSLRDIIVLIAVALSSAAVAALAFVVPLASSGTLSPVDFWPAAIRFWIGDAIGIVVFTPFLLLVATGRLRPLLTASNAVVATLVFVAVGLIFSLPGSAHLQLFYLLFLPIILIALSFGLERVTLGLVLTQIALIFGVYFTQEKAGAVTAFQLLMFVLALTGLLMGAIVTQKKSFELRLRRQHEALAKVTRIGSMGVFGATIAHEISQPLSAIATYAKIVDRELEREDGDRALAAEAARKAIVQVGRVGDIVHGLRHASKLGRSDVGPYPITQILEETFNLLRDDLHRHKITHEVHVEATEHSVEADRVQIEQVLVNVIRNAMQAMCDLPEVDKIISIRIKDAGPGFVEFSISDRGPGFAEEYLEQDLLPLSSTKADGQGLGILISRTIIEAHGGQFRIENGRNGGVVHFTLKAAK